MPSQDFRQIFRHHSKQTCQFWQIRWIPSILQIYVLQQRSPLCRWNWKRKHDTIFLYIFQNAIGNSEILCLIFTKVVNEEEPE